MISQTTSGSHDEAPSNGLDRGIKVLTIIKLLLQVAFYGVVLGGTVWLLINNPLPQIIQAVQEQVVNSVMTK
jgi:hypothetical protein